MSKLFDDSSLAMIPSAVKDGKLYSIRPVPEYGAEEITNGNFATDSNWTKEAGWTISGGKASYNGSVIGNALYQNISAVTGTKYRVSFSVVNYVSGSFKAFLSDGGATGSSPLITANGDYVFDMTAEGVLLVFRNVTSFNGSIDNVSVQEIVSSGDFTFSRGSNLAATRVDVNGLIEKGRENLLLQSNQFDTTWVTPDATITSGQADKDGSNNAWLLTATSAFNRVVQSVSQSGVKRFSVYAKANTNDYLLLGSFEGAHFYATFNLATGAVDSNNANVISPSIENVGNGWYRCSATWVGTTTEVRIASQATSGQGGWASTTSGSVLIQDAQLEQGLVATDYIETGASTAQAGILEDLPRLDYSGSCPALLLEPQRTNGAHYSEYFDSYYDADVNFDNITITHNAIISPDGLQNAAKLAGNNTSKDPTNAYIGRNTLVASQPYVSSVFAKAGEYDYAVVTIGSYASGFWASFNLDTGVVDTQPTAGNTTASIEDYGDGWYRCIIHTTNTAGSEGIYFSPSVDGTTSTNYTNTTNGVYFWGAQVESGSYPTSYIPTMGSAVTRSQEVCSQSFADITTYNQATFFSEFTLDPSNLKDSMIFTIGQSTSAGLLYLLINDTGTISYEYYLNSTQINNGNISVSFNDGKNKVAFKMSSEGIKLYLNGVVIRSTTPNMPSGNYFNNSNIYIARYHTPSFHFVDPYNQFVLFPTALTDSECIALTTL